MTEELLTKMKEEVKKSRDALCRGFAISEEETDTINKWKKEHDEKYHPHRSYGTCGGGWTYMFEPTSIGTFGTICCDRCRYKAMRDAKGDTEKYNKLLKEYDAEFTFQEAF